MRSFFDIDDYQQPTKGLHYFFCKPSVNRSVNLKNRRFQLNFAVFHQKFTGLQLNPFTRLHTRDSKIFFIPLPNFLFFFLHTENLL